MQIQPLMLLMGALLGFVGVAAGAFGAHALKHRLSVEMLAVFEVGVRYQMYHAFALLIAAWAITLAGGWAIAAGWCFIVGTLIFSGSLYCLALSGIKTFGAVTPIGGVILLMGWLALAVGAWKGAVQ